MIKSISHSVVLVATIAVSFFLSKMISTELDLQVSAVLFAMYFVLKKVLPKKTTAVQSTFTNHALLDSVFYTLIIMNIVHTTGGAASSLFFLTYFLVFALALLIEPLQSMVTTFTMIIFFLADVPSGSTSMDHLLPILSLPFMTPFSLFLGKEFRKAENQRKVISRMKNRENALEEEMQKEKKDNANFLSLIVKEHIKKLREHSDNFTGDHDLREIQKTVHRMEKLIEKYEETL